MVLFYNTNILSLTASREGVSPSDRWKWNETVGPLENRPGREGLCFGTPAQCEVGADNPSRRLDLS